MTTKVILRKDLLKKVTDFLEIRDAERELSKMLGGKVPSLIGWSAIEGFMADLKTYLTDRSSDKGYMVSVSGQSAPRFIHSTYTPAYQEAVRLAKLSPNSEVSILSVVKVLKAETVVKEIA